MKPRIFVSAVSSELGQTRQLAANILLRLGYDPVWQDIFGTEAGDLRKMLREKIDDCEGLLHLVGRAYGFEPPTPDAEFGRVSYTQYELLYAQKTGKRTWVLFVEDSFPTDRPFDQLDLPSDPQPADPASWQEERRKLQDDWRQRLRGESHLWHAAKNRPELELKLERLKDEFQILRQSFATWQRIVMRNLVAVVVLIVLLTAGVGWALFRQPDVKQVVADSVEQTIQTKSADIAQAVVARQIEELKPDLIKTQFRKQVEETYRQDLADAEKLTDWKQRDAAKKSAAESRERTLKQVDAFVESIADTVKAGDATAEYLELTRILQEQGVEEASAYVTREESRLLKDVEHLPADQKRELQKKLTPLLEGVNLLRSRGKMPEAAALCEKLLALDPDWPELLEAHVRIQLEQGELAEKYTTLAAAKTHYEAALKSARRQSVLAGTQRQGLINLSIVWERLGDVSRWQGLLTESEQFYLESVQQTQALIDQEPHERNWLRNQAIIYGRLSNLATERGSSDEALEFGRERLAIAERLSTADQNNPQWRRDLSIARDQLGNLMTDLGRYAEAEEYYLQSLTVREQAWKEQPENPEAQRDLLVSNDLLGNLRKVQNQWHEALRHFTKEREFAEALVKADPENRNDQDSLSLALSKVGNVQRNLGEWDTARQTLRQAVELIQRLLAGDEQNVARSDDLSKIYDDLGIIASAKGEFAEAEFNFSQSRDIRLRLTALEPTNRVWQRNLGISHRFLAELQFQKSHWEEAEKLHRQALVIRRELHQANPDNTLWRNDLRITLNDLGRLAEKQNLFEEAVGYFRESRKLCQLFVDAAPHDTYWLRELGNTDLDLGIAYTALQKYEESVTWYRQALEARRRLAEIDRKNETWRRDEWVTHWFIAEDLEAIKDETAKDDWLAAHRLIAAMLTDGFTLSESDQKTFEKIKAKADE